MGMMETSPLTLAPMILKNLVTTIFIYADKSLVTLAGKYKLLEFLRYTLVACILFLLRVIPSLFSYLDPNPDGETNKNGAGIDLFGAHNIKLRKGDAHAPSSASGESGIARALWQLLSSVNDIPVSSRKYEVVRSLAERLIDENHMENVEALNEVNRTVLSAAFSRILNQLEAAMDELGRAEDGGGLGFCSEPMQYQLRRLLRAVRIVKGGRPGRRISTGAEDGLGSLGCTAEKLAAEVIWLAQKMTACDFGEEAVWRWASASNLARVAVTAEPRLQCCLVKISAFLFKQAKDMGLEDFEESKAELHRQMKKKMLVSWLPLLCRASNGTDVPVLSTRERAELERLLEGIVEELEREEQEQVLSMWLHHFTHCPSSDWPNLYTSYAKWCTASRKHLILQ